MISLFPKKDDSEFTPWENYENERIFEHPVRLVSTKIPTLKTILFRKTLVYTQHITKTTYTRFRDEAFFITIIFFFITFIFFFYKIGKLWKIGKTQIRIVL